MSVQQEAISVTPDNRITKIPLTYSTQPNKEINWTRGVNALLHFTVYAYTNPSRDASTHSDACQQGCSHGHTHGSSKHSDSLDTLAAMMKSNGPVKTPSIQPDLSKPVRKKVSDSQTFDSSDEEGKISPPFELRIGYGFSVKALEICVKTMRVGDRARFLCMPEYCDGFVQLETLIRQERQNRINKAKGLPLIKLGGCCAHSMADNMDLTRDLVDVYGSPLEFDIELVGVQMPDEFVKEPWEMEAGDKYREAPVVKDEGAVLYRQGEFAAALKKFERALVLLESLASSAIVMDLKKDRLDDKRRRSNSAAALDPNGEHQRLVTESEIDLDTLDSLTVTCRLNYAACELKLGHYSSAIIQCTEVLKHQPKNLKALFRRSQAYTSIGRDLDLATNDLDKFQAVLEASPDVFSSNGPEWREYRQQRTVLDTKLKKHALTEKKMYSNIFQ